MKITVRTMQHNSETKVIEVSSGLMTVGELRKKIASAFFSASESSSSSSSASLNMFLRGAALNDDDERANIKPGDTVLVNFQPVVSSSARSQQQTKLNKGKQFSSLNFLQRTLIRNRNKKGRGFFSFFSPNAARFFIVICSTAVIRFILGTFFWCCVAKMAYSYDLGPVFVLCSLFYFMFSNMSNAPTTTNKDGKLSAYSLFNKNFETLPGTFDAMAVERNVRQNHDNDNTT